MITPAGTAAYVTNHSSRSVIPIMTATNTAGSPIGAGAGPEDIAITPNGKTVYVANTGGDPATVTPISTATGKAGTAITIGAGPGDLAFAITPRPKR